MESLRLTLGPDYLHDRASELNNQTVVIEGHLEMVEGIEIPNSPLNQARTIFGTPELESLQCWKRSIHPVPMYC